MKRSDRGHVLRALAGELGPEEQKALRARLAHDAALRAEMERMHRLDALLRASREASFAPGFSSRVLRRLAPAPTRSTAMLASTLQRQFFRLAPVAMAALLILGAHNLVRADGAGRSAVEAALGLPAVTLDAVYASDATLYSLEPRGEIDESTN